MGVPIALSIEVPTRQQLFAVEWDTSSRVITARLQLGKLDADGKFARVPGYDYAVQLTGKNYDALEAACAISVTDIIGKTYAQLQAAGKIK